MGNLEEKLIEIFKRHKGRENAISRGALEILTREKDRNVRAAISNLRVHGYPIISLHKGYYWAIGEDLVAFIRREESRAKTVLRIVNRLKKKPLPKIRNQMDLFDGE